MRLVVCTPSLGKVALHRERAMMRLAVECDRRGLDFDPGKDVWDNTMAGALFHARNCLLYRIADELEEEDFAFWLDSDVSLEPVEIFELFKRDEYIVAKGYPLKPSFDLGIAYSAFPLRTRTGALVFSEDRRLIEATGCGFGAVMMRPWAARALRDLLGVRGMGGHSDKSIPAFDFIDNKRGDTCPEDVGFAIRWREQLSEKLEETQRIWISPHGRVRNGEHAGVFAESIGLVVG
jgi:hypothetical protein